MNTERIADRTKCSVYILTLSTHIPAKRQKEALEMLRSLHPTGLTGEKIAIRKNPRSKSEYICILSHDTAEKTLFTTFLALEAVARRFTGTVLFKTEAFIERLDFSNGSLKKTALISEKDADEITPSLILTPKSTVFLKKKALKSALFFAVLVSAIALSLYSHRLSAVHAENTRMQNEILKQKKKQAQEKAEKEKFLANLMQTNEELYTGKTASPYEITSIIYSNIRGKALIKSLSVTGNDFVLEAESKDGTAILASFEQDGNVMNAGIQHIIFHEQGKDLFILTGTVILPREEPPLHFTTEEKIRYYLEKNEAASVSPNTALTHSQYTDRLRTLLRSCSLEPSSIQNMNSDTAPQSEYTVRGSIQSLINFLYQAKEKDIEFTTLRLQQQMQETTATFRVKLPPSEENKTAPTEPPEFFPKEIAGTFVRTPKKTSPVSQKTAVLESPSVEKAEKKVMSANFLTYIGQVKTGETITAYVKNSRNGEILKIPYSADGKLYITLGNETYEVHQ